jgi:hypothetical protein
MMTRVLFVLLSDTLLVQIVQIDGAD